MAPHFCKALCRALNQSYKAASQPTNERSKQASKQASERASKQASERASEQDRASKHQAAKQPSSQAAKQPSNQPASQPTRQLVAGVDFVHGQSGGPGDTVDARIIASTSTILNHTTVNHGKVENRFPINPTKNPLQHFSPKKSTNLKSGEGAWASTPGGLLGAEEVGRHVGLRGGGLLWHRGLGFAGSRAWGSGLRGSRQGLWRCRPTL